MECSNYFRTPILDPPPKVGCGLSEYPNVNKGRNLFDTFIDLTFTNEYSSDELDEQELPQNTTIQGQGQQVNKLGKFNIQQISKQSGEIEDCKNIYEKKDLCDCTFLLDLSYEETRNCCVLPNSQTEEINPLMQISDIDWFGAAKSRRQERKLNKTNTPKYKLAYWSEGRVRYDNEIPEYMQITDKPIKEIEDLNQPIIVTDKDLKEPMPAKVVQNATVSRKKEKFACAVCEKVFDRPSSLKTHMVIHNKFKNRCPVCDHIFGKKSRTSDMRNHKDTHPQPYRCPDCMNWFHKYGRLLNHRSYGCNDKPYRCNICNALFLNLKELHRHAKSKHSGRVRKKQV